MILHLRVPPLCVFLHHFLINDKAQMKIPNTAACLLSHRQIFGCIHSIFYVAATFPFNCIR